MGYNHCIVPFQGHKTVGTQPSVRIWCTRCVHSAAEKRRRSGKVPAFGAALRLYWRLYCLYWHGRVAPPTPVRLPLGFVPKLQTTLYTSCLKRLCQAATVLRKNHLPNTLTQALVWGKVCVHVHICPFEW